MLYNSFNGRFSDNPRAIYEELLRRGSSAQHHWIASGDRDAFPGDATKLPPHSLRYQRAAGRAGYIVSNVQMPTNFRKPRGATYLQTWHGTPLKQIGFDNDRWTESPGGLERIAREFGHWDFLVSQNPFSTEIFRRAFRFDGEILESGYPRNDVLNSPEAPAIRARVRSELRIPDGVRAILYAPTWRDDIVDAKGAPGFSTELDAERLGEAQVLLLRLHYMLSARMGDAVGTNVSAYPDIRDLYLAADVLITDYSSAMFDFAVTGKPMVFFTYDLDEYRDSVRGFYFDLEAEAPGPVCSTTDAVIAALEDLDAQQARYASTYQSFRERFCPYDDGGAAGRVVDRVFDSSPPASR